ncbi:MAG: hypothetical protein NT027_17020 [Proteobacteria bacterium]|nr:hypothetical protein [Pseudomonadota bacterium]
MSLKIPIKNIYYMLCYAWQHLDSLSRDQTSALDVCNMTDLFGRILKECVTDLIKKGLHRDYIETTEQMVGIKGKLLVTPSVQKSLFQLGQSICVTDEYSLNNPLNQLVLSTMQAMTNVKDLDAGLKDQLCNLTTHFRGVETRRVSSRDFANIRMSRLNHHYEHTLKVCSLIWDQLTPEESTGRYIFEEFNRDEAKMRRVFEDFVRNFYKIEGPKSNTFKAETIRWQETSNDTQEKTLLPVMKTDTCLISSSCYTVIETKFVPEALQHRFASSDKIRSGHLYQLMAYLENIRRRNNVNLNGILLYPEVDFKIEERYKLWDFDVQIRTINLMQDWPLIRRDLLEMIQTRGEEEKVAAGF